MNEPIQSVDGDANGKAAAQEPLAIDDIPQSFFTKLIAIVKNTKELIAGITVIAGALAFAINYFATTKALECFKAETKRNEELIQKILQINDLLSSWKIAIEKVETLDKLRNAQSTQLGTDAALAATNQFYNARADANEVEARLKAARDRRNELEKSDKPCQ